MKTFTAIAIEAGSTDTYFREKSASIYGAKSEYKYVLTFDKVALTHINSDTGERRDVIVDSQEFYDGLEYKGTYEGSILNRFRY
jgi:hypothetical protein